MRIAVRGLSTCRSSARFVWRKTFATSYASLRDELQWFSRFYSRPEAYMQAWNVYTLKILKFWARPIIPRVSVGVASKQHEIENTWDSVLCHCQQCFSDIRRVLVRYVHCAVDGLAGLGIAGMIYITSMISASGTTDNPRRARSSSWSQTYTNTNILVTKNIKPADRSVVAPVQMYWAIYHICFRLLPSHSCI